MCSSDLIHLHVGAVAGLAGHVDGPARGSSAGVAGEAGDGSYVEVYVDDVNEDVTVIIVHTYLGQITDVDDSDADAIVYTVEVYGEGANDMDATSLDITTADSGYAEDDYVLVTAASEDDGASYELQSIALADIVSGAVTTYEIGRASCRERV